MKKKTLLLFSLFLFSAKSFAQKKPCARFPSLQCAHVKCIQFWYSFRFKITDKKTGKDLVFDPEARYTANDIKLYADSTLRQTLTLKADTVNKIFNAPLARKRMYLKVNKTVYKLNVNFGLTTCCSARVKDVFLNGKTICQCCADVVSLPVE
ncbi:MAG: hypothetical protein N2747_09190 [Chitinophagaceae bacterium]|nr:hypothetical protein [Chitinophagaceae bacterium]